MEQVMENATPLVAAPTGFTGSEATKRLRDKAGKVQVSFLALSMMAKMKGKTNKAIRNDLGENCPTWISKIFTMADKVMAHIQPGAQDEIGRMTVAKAEEMVTAFISGHMTALGVGAAFEKYGKVCHFQAECDASKAVLNPPADAPEPEAKDDTPPADKDADGKPADAPEVDVLENMRNAWAHLTLEQAEAFHQWSAEMLLKAHEAEAEAGRKAA